MTRVALDLMGGDHAPDALVDGALLVADERPDTSDGGADYVIERLGEVVELVDQERAA